MFYESLSHKIEKHYKCHKSNYLVVENAKSYDNFILISYSGPWTVG